MPSSFFLQGEVDILKSRLAKLEREKKELEEANEKLQQKVSKLIAWRHSNISAKLLISRLAFIALRLDEYIFFSNTNFPRMFGGRVMKIYVDGQTYLRL